MYPSSRRDFLRRMGLGAGSAAMLSAIEHLTLTSAFAQGPNYKALVCIFLGGGNDGNNMIIPRLNTNVVGNRYTNYSAVRPDANRLNIPMAQLLPVNPASAGGFGFHPNLGIPNATYPNGHLHSLWTQNKLAVVCNVGPLVQPLMNPTPRAAYANTANKKPFQLFSHSDQVQQWQTSISNQAAQAGWGGRTADRFPNHISNFPMITSIAGNARFCLGQQRRPLTMAAANNVDPNAQPPINPNLRTVLTLNGFGDTLAHRTARQNSMNFLRTIDNGPILRATASEVMNQSLQIAAVLAQAGHVQTRFPATALGNQLLQVARVIKVNRDRTDVLDLPRQIFFVSLGGFDTHRGQAPNATGGQNGLLTQLSQAMAAFYAATVEMGISDKVTTFTLSDFGRTFEPSNPGLATVGSDHAWSNHMLVMGDAVQGGNFYGVNGPHGTPYPRLTMQGDDDATSRGRWVPYTSVDQYSYTLARWFGLQPADRDYVFPALVSGGFNPQYLSFMG